MPWQPALQPEGQTILMVDDTPANLGVLAHVLEESGLQVLVAQDGEEAIARARRAHPDLILLDVMMPGIDGFETCRRLKSLEETRDIPVIFMTALLEQTDKLAGFEAGAVDYVTKPFEVEEVLARVRTHLSLRAMREQLAQQNALLQQQIALREQAEASLRLAYDDLEQRVAERTAELEQANTRLTKEIAERQRMQDTLLRNEARLRRLFESNIIGIYFWTVGGIIADANDAFLDMLGHTREELRNGILSLDRVAPVDASNPARAQAIDEMMRSGTCAPFEATYVRKDGNRIPALIGGAFFNDDRQDGVAFVLDLSRHKEAEDRILYIATHDGLTGLPNRSLLQDRLKQAIAQAHRNGTQVALLFLDLDYFKHINDSLGHHVGDCVLRMAAQRLLECVREDDSVGRLGGDEFVLILHLPAGSDHAALVAQKALDAMVAPFRCEGHELHVSGSIGISLFPEDGDDVETLMRNADTAMYHAKERGRGNFQFFTQALNRAAQWRLTLGNALRNAIAHHELVVYYQPQVNMADGRIFSAEALLRWHRPGQEAISCNEFITVAEETGLILPIGEWVLREACRQLKEWHELGFDELTIAVNLSPRQFFQPDFLGMVRNVLQQSRLSAGSLDLEITEGMLMQRTEDNVATLKQLSGMGVKLSVDDFGTGYSSLAYLQRFPVDALKIDRSFISGIDQDRNHTALVGAIISMAHSLHLNVLAEGVETPEQIRFLQSHGCRSAQGFYYSEPVPAAEFTTLLHKQRRQHI